MSLIDLSIVELAMAFAVVFFGAFAQGVVGFGLALLIGPLLSMISPVFLPGPVVLLVSVITASMAWNGRKAVNVDGVKRSIGGYLLGTLVAAAIISSLPQRETAFLLGGLILCAVGISVAGIHLPATRKVLFSAGIVGGFMGTISGVGLPPLALALQSEPGPRLRGTLACVGFISILMAIVALVGVNKIGLRELTISLCLAPAVLLGFAASVKAAPRFDASYTRPAVFLLSALSAAGLIFRNL